jgi:hypothetical protein
MAIMAIDDQKDPNGAKTTKERFILISVRNCRVCWRVGYQQTEQRKMPLWRQTARRI